MEKQARQYAITEKRPGQHIIELLEGIKRMKRRTASLFSVLCLLAAPLLAQTTIGGGACNSESLSGIYAVSVTSRQVTAAGTFTGVSQGTGSATFDGLSAVTINLTANTGQASATPVTWSGTYSVQANCAGVINIATGGSATLNMAIYNSGADFLLSGSDANYSYSGTGNTQPAGCSASTFSGVYTFHGTGFALTGTAVSGVKNGAGLLQFDGVSNVTVNVTMSASGAAPSRAHSHRIVFDIIQLPGVGEPHRCGRQLLRDEFQHLQQFGGQRGRLCGIGAELEIPGHWQCKRHVRAAGGERNGSAVGGLADPGNGGEAAVRLRRSGRTSMKYARIVWLSSLSCLLVAPALAQNQIGGGSCSAATLNGTYALTLSGRAISAAGSLRRYNSGGWHGYVRWQ